ncbi:hypothetical protein L7F22_050432 [Adiantum nelumboides]|nr:hypothetical protein [Adiantum nelumboides]
MLCVRAQETWEHFLPLVAYAYNNTVHTSTGKSPFEIVEGGKKVLPILRTKDKIFEADKYVQNVDEAYRNIKIALEKTQLKQKKAADCHRRELVFSLGDWVLLPHFEKTSGIRARLISLLQEVRSKFCRSTYGFRRRTVESLYIGDAGGEHNEDFGNEYGSPLPTEKELREMEHRRLVGEATNMMLNFAKDPKLVKYMTETAFQDVHAQWKATTTSKKKQYSEKELEEEIEARLARILGAQDKGKKHDKKRRKSTDFPGYLGNQSTFDKAKNIRSVQKFRFLLLLLLLLLLTVLQIQVKKTEKAKSEARNDAARTTVIMPIDPYWQYATRGGAYAAGGVSRKWKCNFCGYEKTGSVTRVKDHLGRVPGKDVSLCQHVPADVMASLEGWRRQRLGVDTGSDDVEQAGTGHAALEASSSRVAPSKRIDEIKAIWQKRWDWFHRPLHAVAHVLHPLWRSEDQSECEELEEGFQTYV